MSDINKLALVINGLVRNQDLSSNTLVVSNLKVRLGGTNHFTFSGTLTANRTITVPDADVDLGVLIGSSFIRADGSVAFTADQSMGGNRLTNLGAPTSPSDAANKQYVDSVAEGLKPKAAVRVATTSNIALSGLITVDGVALSSGDRVLVKDQTNSEENGIYIASTSSWVRASDFDQLTPINEIKGAYVAVTHGTTNQGKIFVCVSDPSTLGVDPIQFVFFNSVSTLVAGSGIQISGNNISVLTKTSGDGSGLIFSGNELLINVDNQTLELSLNTLQVKDGGIDSDKLASNSVDSIHLIDGSVIESKIASGAVSSSKIQTNAVTTNKISDDAVVTSKIANDAVTTAKIADNAVTEPKLQDGSVTTNKISNLAVTTSKIDNGAVTEPKLADGAVTTNKIANLAVDNSKLANNAVSAAKIDSSAVDGSTIVGGSGTPLSAVRTFRVTIPSSYRVAGESFSAGIWVVRWGKDSLSETAGRLYKADNLESNDQYDAIGFASTSSNLTAGGSFVASNVVVYGLFELASPVFSSSDVGKIIYLGSAGNFTLTPPSANGTAVVELGVVVDTNAIWVKSPVLRGIN